MILDVHRTGIGVGNNSEIGYLGFDAFEVFEKSQLEGEIESFAAHFGTKLAEGNYSDLSSKANRQFFSEYLALFDEETQARLRAAAITPWLVESYKMTQNIVSEETPELLSNEKIIRDGVASPELFDSVLDVLSMMAKFKETSDPWSSFAGLEKSPLFGDQGFLRIRSSDRNDSLYQQANLVILGMRGLDTPQLYSLFSYVQYERVSRAKIGKTPAVMSIALENNVPEKDEDIVSLENRIKYGWGTPPGPGESTEARLVWKKGDVASAYESLVIGVKQGSYLPERHLAMMGKNKLKKLLILRQKVLSEQPKKGWNQPLWRDPTTGRVLGRDGEVIAEPQKIEVSSQVDKEHNQKKNPINLILGLLGLIKTSKL